MIGNFYNVYYPMQWVTANTKKVSKMVKIFTSKRLRQPHVLFFPEEGIFNSNSNGVCDYESFEIAELAAQNLLRSTGKEVMILSAVAKVELSPPRPITRRLD